MRTSVLWSTVAVLCLATGCGSASGASGGTTTLPAAPGVRFVTPAAAVTVSKSLPYELEVGGNVGKIYFQFRDQQTFTIAQFEVPPPYRGTFDMTNFAQDTFSLKVQTTLDGAKFVSEERIVTVDHTPPTVLSQSGGVAGAPLTLVFSEPVDPQSINWGPGPMDVEMSVWPYAFEKLNEALTVAIPAKLNIAGDTLTLTPDESLQLPCEVFLVGTTITDLAGNALTIPGWEVDSVAPIGEHLGDISGEPRMARDGQGRLVLAWLDRTTGTSYLRAYRLEAGAWVPMTASPLNVEPNNDGTGQPDLVIDRDGNPVIAWSEFTYASARSDLYVARWKGDHFERMPIVGNTKPTHSAYRPSVQVDDQNRVLVFFSESFNDGVNLNDATYIKRWSGTAWETLYTGPGDANGRQFTLHVDAKGQLWFIRDYGGSNTAIEVQKYDGTAFQVFGTRIGGANGAASGNEVKGGRLDFDKAGAPIVSYVAVIANYGSLEFVRWDGTKWATFAGSLIEGNGSFMHLDADDRPTVVTNAPTVIPESPMPLAPNLKTPAIFARVADGTTWQPLPGMYQMLVSGGQMGGNFAQSTGNKSLGAWAWDATGHVDMAVIYGQLEGDHLRNILGVEHLLSL